MSAITIAGDTSGSVTLDAPAVAGTTVLTLPATSGTVLTNTGALGVSTSAPANSLVVNASGNVGVGTTSPSTILEISKSTSTGTISATPSIVLSNRNNTNSTFVAGGIFANMFRDISNPAYAAGVWFERVPKSSNNDSGGNIIFGAMENSTSGTPTERMRIDSSGVPMFNCTSQLIRGGETFRAQLTAGIASFITSTGSFPVIALRNTGTNGYMMAFNNAGAEIGTISSSGSNVAYNTSSDYRLKENIAPMVGALNTIAQLKPVTYDWIADKSKGQGFIAHELAEVVPDAVTGEKDAVDEEGNPKYQGVDTSFLVATLTAAIQELNAKVEAQAEQIKALQGAV
jgi:hypothetical protein